MRTHINSCGSLEVLGPVFEGQLVLRARPSLVVESALAQNEVVIVEVKQRGVIEEYFPNLAIERVVVDIYSKIELLKSLGCRLPKFEKAVLAREPIGLQQNFVLAIVDYVTGEMLRFGVFAYVLVHGSPSRLAATHFGYESILRTSQILISSSITLASFRSGVSKPSVKLM